MGDRAGSLRRSGAPAAAGREKDDAEVQRGCFGGADGLCGGDGAAADADAAADRGRWAGQCEAAHPGRLPVFSVQNTIDGRGQAYLHRC